MAVGGSTFTVAVDGIGEFTFKRRNMRLNIAIQVEYARLSEGVDLPPAIADFVAMASAVKVLAEEAPKGWNVDELDGFDEDSYAKVATVWSALREKETTFLKGSAAASPNGGALAGAVDGVLVPAEVPAPADGPTLS